MHTQDAQIIGRRHDKMYGSLKITVARRHVRENVRLLSALFGCENADFKMYQTCYVKSKTHSLLCLQKKN